MYFLWRGVLVVIAVVCFRKWQKGALLSTRSYFLASGTILYFICTSLLAYFLYTLGNYEANDTQEFGVTVVYGLNLRPFNGTQFRTPAGHRRFILLGSYLLLLTNNQADCRRCTIGTLLRRVDSEPNNSALGTAYSLAQNAQLPFSAFIFEAYRGGDAVTVRRILGRRLKTPQRGVHEAFRTTVFTRNNAYGDEFTAQPLQERPTASTQLEENSVEEIDSICLSKHGNDRMKIITPIDLGKPLHSEQHGRPHIYQESERTCMAESIYDIKSAYYDADCILSKEFLDRLRQAKSGEAVLNVLGEVIGSERKETLWKEKSGNPDMSGWNCRTTKVQDQIQVNHRLEKEIQELMMKEGLDGFRFILPKKRVKKFLRRNLKGKDLNFSLSALSFFLSRITGSCGRNGKRIMHTTVKNDSKTYCIDRSTENQREKILGILLNQVANRSEEIKSCLLRAMQIALCFHDQCRDIPNFVVERIHRLLDQWVEGKISELVGNGHMLDLAPGGLFLERDSLGAAGALCISIMHSMFSLGLCYPFFNDNSTKLNISKHSASLLTPTVNFIQEQIIAILTLLVDVLSPYRLCHFVSVLNGYNRLNQRFRRPLIDSGKVQPWTTFLSGWTTLAIKSSSLLLRHATTFDTNEGHLNADKKSTDTATQIKRNELKGILSCSNSTGSLNKDLNFSEFNLSKFGGKTFNKDNEISSERVEDRCSLVSGCNFTGDKRLRVPRSTNDDKAGHRFHVPALDLYNKKIFTWDEPKHPETLQGPVSVWKNAKKKCDKSNARCKALCACKGFLAFGALDASRGLSATDRWEVSLRFLDTLACHSQDNLSPVDCVDVLYAASLLQLPPLPPIWRICKTLVKGNSFPKELKIKNQLLRLVSALAKLQLPHNDLLKMLSSEICLSLAADSRTVGSSSTMQLWTALDIASVLRLYHANVLKSFQSGINFPANIDGYPTQKNSNLSGILDGVSCKLLQAALGHCLSTVDQIHGATGSSNSCSLTAEEIARSTGFDLEFVKFLSYQARIIASKGNQKHAADDHVLASLVKDATGWRTRPSVITEHGIYLQAVVEVPVQSRKSSSKQIGIIVLSAHHFSRGSNPHQAPTLTASTCFKLRLLRRQGWTIVPVPFWELCGDVLLEERKAFLLKRLDMALNGRENGKE